ncbi:MAG TPA: adenylate/guanylate cyclase domain-containing protein [Anaerolineae bacterium]|nr:adenylate/guanylate cyclase domain-containing protein [Anaerolineae bacterium]HQK12828.1 adenylate/guanylate cyclase domain-containing protein [Anaerolineae bacterium]
MDDAAPEYTLPEEPVSQLSATGPSEQTILVVEDSPTQALLLEALLDQNGHNVIWALDGRQGLAMARHFRPDLIILDMEMPELNGDEVLRMLKAEPALQHIPVVMVSAFDDIERIARCIELGAEDYLPKPVNAVLLNARVGACLEKKRLRDQEIEYLRRIEAERRRFDELLHVILPPEIVTELKNTGTVKPRQFPNVAVLFADIVNFTPYCETHTPEDILTNLQALVETYENLALRYGLQKIKTLGDAFMATAGLLRSLNNPVLNCVRCGLEMIPAARRLPAGWQVRVGIHIGPVMAGVVGHRQYLFDIWGNTVNTAERVQSHGAVEAVNLSEDAWSWVKDQCIAESLGLVPVKGKGEMPIYRVQALRS